LLGICFWLLTVGPKPDGLWTFVVDGYMMIMDKIVDFIRDKKPSKKIENAPLTG
jgi:hypothetical protein